MNTKGTQKSYTIDNTFLDNDEKAEYMELLTIYLNRPCDIDMLSKLHKLSTYSVMADGAANYFHDTFADNHDNEIFPDAIVGDLDSIRDEVTEYYKNNSIQVIKNPSQDDSDLEKCFNHILKWFEDHPLSEEKQYKIVVTGAMGGRMDHTLNNIHILHKFSLTCAEIYDNISILLVDDNSVATCILPGKTRYHKAKQFEQQKGCGIFPMIGEVPNVKTKGFKWNLDENTPPLNFKKFISSSNEFAEDIVEFETENILFITTTSAYHSKSRYH